jgi:hydantoinase/carbamoylase family amidase
MAELSAIGGSGTSVTRLGLSPEEQRARELVGGWLSARGATVRRDPAANVYGRFGEGTGPAVLVGSHLDSVPDGGRFAGALGVVSDIVGILHARVTVHGRQDHAGATIMSARRDALAAASEMVLAVELAARALADAVGTVGEIAVRPGAKNVVPGECVFSLDLRARSEATLEQLTRDVRAAIRRIGDARGVRSSVDVLSRVAAVPLDPNLRDLFLRCAAQVGIDAPELFSGAGHDAENSQLAGVPTGMLFVRSTGGSHNPNELAAADDAVLGARALALALKELAG